MSLVNKKSVIVLYSNNNDMYSHRSRLVLAEKGVTVDVLDVARVERPEDIADLNPYGMAPTLVDKDLVLYESRIIMEYLDERFPHPPLLPVYPVARAQCRLTMYRVDRDWYSLAHQIEKGDAAETAREELTENLISIATVFEETPYFLSEEFTLVDCCMGVLLWRLPALGIELPDSAKALEAYAERIFERPAFQASLTDTEAELRMPLE
jgi:stringent starvation protein A